VPEREGKTEERGMIDERVLKIILSLEFFYGKGG